MASSSSPRATLQVQLPDGSDSARLSVQEVAELLLAQRITQQSPVRYLDPASGPADWTPLHQCERQSWWSLFEGELRKAVSTDLKSTRTHTVITVRAPLACGVLTRRCCGVQIHPF